MSRYTLTVEYAAGNVQVHENLTPKQIEQGVGAFLGDLLDLEGEGIVRLEVKIEAE
jgi:hypothetical protein